APAPRALRGSGEASTDNRPAAASWHSGIGTSALRRRNRTGPRVRPRGRRGLARARSPPAGALLQRQDDAGGGAGTGRSQLLFRRVRGAGHPRARASLSQAALDPGGGPGPTETMPGCGTWGSYRDPAAASWSDRGLSISPRGAVAAPAALS